jgi:hypothetical protein
MDNGLHASYAPSTRARTDTRSIGRAPGSGLGGVSPGVRGTTGSDTEKRIVRGTQIAHISKHGTSGFGIDGDISEIYPKSGRI